MTTEDIFRKAFEAAFESIVLDNIKPLIDQELKKMITKKWIRDQIEWYIQNPSDIQGLEEYIQYRMLEHVKLSIDSDFAKLITSKCSSESDA